MPQGFRIAEAWLSEVVAFTRDPDGLPRTEIDVVLAVVDRFGQPIIPEADFAWSARRTLPLPADDNIVRVAGNIGQDGFLFGGSTWFHRLMKLTRRYTGRNLLTFDAVLDWGVGCGRIARHFLERDARNIYGADIDRVNVAWCNENLGWGATHIDFDPPMPWPNGFFDIIYGHSVFTHLAFDDQFRWLAELRRVLKPGGFAFVTVCSEAGLYMTRWRDFEEHPEIIKGLLTDGFYDIEAQPVGVDAGREGYYRLVAHTRRFIAEQWSKFFMIRRILPCYFDHQDLVILQKTTDVD
jgi:SAM-dependent methyltransferase